MELLQIFAICALYTTVNFVLTVTVQNGGPPISIEYPFKFGEQVCKSNTSAGAIISADVSSDARFFVATSVLSILYCIFICVVYACIDEIYTSKPEVPLAVSQNDDSESRAIFMEILKYFWFDFN